ncbi:MAG: hypothetical protein V1835_06135 [Candidatus Micrarchaeota archaeon]
MERFKEKLVELKEAGVVARFTPFGVRPAYPRGGFAEEWKRLGFVSRKLMELPEKIPAMSTYKIQFASPQARELFVGWVRETVGGRRHVIVSAGKQVKSRFIFRRGFGVFCGYDGAVGMRLRVHDVNYPVANLQSAHRASLQATIGRSISTGDRGLPVEEASVINSLSMRGADMGKGGTIANTHAVLRERKLAVRVPVKKTYGSK